MKDNNIDNKLEQKETDKLFRDLKIKYINEAREIRERRMTIVHTMSYVNSFRYSQRKRSDFDDSSDSDSD